MKKIFIILFIIISLALTDKMLTKAFAQTPSFPVSVNITRPQAVVHISQNLWGMNYWNNSNSNLDQFYSVIDREKASKLRIKFWRFPGGCDADFYDWKNSETYYQQNYPSPTPSRIIRRKVLSVDDGLTIAKGFGAEVLYVVNADTKGAESSCNTITMHKGSIQEAVDLVQNYKGQIKYYEIGNEPWGAKPWEVWSPQEYGQTALEFARAMKQIDQSIKIGIVGFPLTVTNRDGSGGISDANREWTDMVKNMLTRKCGNADCFDFVTDHPYPSAGYDPNISAQWNFKGMSAYYPSLNLNEMLTKRLTDYQPKKIALTEWSLACWSVSSSGTVEDGMFTLESQLIFAQKGIDIANIISYSLSSEATNFDKCGLFASRDKWSPKGEAYALSSVLAGGEMLETGITVAESKYIPPQPSCQQYYCLKDNTNAPYISAYSGYDKDHDNLYIFLINRHTEKQADVNINLVDYWDDKKIVSAKYLEASDFTDQSFISEETQSGQLGSDNKFSITVPPISIIRLQIGNTGGWKVTKPVDTPTATLTPTSTVTPTPDLNITPSPTINQTCSPVNFGCGPGVPPCCSGLSCQPPPPPNLKNLKLIGTCHTITGDINSDGKVDIFDYNLLVGNFGKTGATGWIAADINSDGKVDIFDYNILVGNFGK